VTLTFELDSVKVNQQTKYLVKMSFCSKVIVWTHRQMNKHTHTRLTALLRPLKQ